MVRSAVVALVSLALVACTGGGPKINTDDPWVDLFPWDETREDILTTENGVEYIFIHKGEGTSEFPKPTDEVEVHYAGRLVETGAEFDSSYERGETTSFRLNQVIPGWTEGLQKMQIGDQVMFKIPSELGYGAMGSGTIPPQSDLMFRVELFNITPAPAPDAEAWEKVTPWPTDSSDVVRTESGLEYLIVESAPDDAPIAGPKDFAVVDFEGRLDDGIVADSTFQTQNPAVFPIEQLVPGWSETLQLMRQGDHWMVRMPPHLMYGEEGYGRIPPNTYMNFEIIVKEVVKIETLQQPQDAPAEEVEGD